MLVPTESQLAPKQIKTRLCIHHNELTQEG